MASFSNCVPRKKGDLIKIYVIATSNAFTPSLINLEQRNGRKTVGRVIFFFFFSDLYLHCLFTSPQREIREKRGSWARSWAGWKNLVSRRAACCSFLLMYTSTPGTIIRIKGRVLQRGFPAPMFAPLYFSFDRLGLFYYAIFPPRPYWFTWKRMKEQGRRISLCSSLAPFM